MAHGDPRNARTEQRIEDALLATLEDKTLAEICVSEAVLRAQVSRSTFYAHFNNLDEVFERLIDRFNEGVRPFGKQITCSECREERAGIPFCQRVRTAGKYKPLVQDPQFLPRALMRSEHMLDFTSARVLAERGVAADIAQAIGYFQICGCYAVATHFEQDADWSRIQNALDAFIAAGLRAVR